LAAAHLATVESRLELMRGNKTSAFSRQTNDHLLSHLLGNADWLNSAKVSAQIEVALI
jgi:hypothetical protein